MKKSDMSKEQKKKFEKVMAEYKRGKLRSGTGDVVTDKDQAIAIAMAQAGVSKGKIQKAKNYSGLVKKVITNKQGKNQTVWVKPDQKVPDKKPQKKPENKPDKKKKLPTYENEKMAMKDYINGELSIDELQQVSDKQFGKEVANKKELDNFLGNKFMIGMMAMDINASEQEIVSKVKKLRDSLS